MNRRISTEFHQHILLKALPPSGAARSARRGRRARRDGCRVVTLSPSFMPPVHVVHAAVHAAPPDARAAAPFGRGAVLTVGRPRRDIRRLRRQCRSGHRQRFRGAGGTGGSRRRALAACRNDHQSGRNHQWISYLLDQRSLLNRTATVLIRIGVAFVQPKGQSAPATAFPSRSSPYPNTRSDRRRKHPIPLDIDSRLSAGPAGRRR